MAESVWPEFKKIMVAEMETIKQGDPSEPTNFMGPVIARPAFDKISGIITKAKEAGGEMLSGGTCACDGNALLTVGADCRGLAVS